MPWRDSTGAVVGTFGISKDVTALKETETKLAYERDLLQTLLDKLPDTIYFKDLQSRFTRVSRSKAERSLHILRASYRQSHPADGPEETPPHLADIDQVTPWLIGKTDADVYTAERAHAAY